MGNESLTFPVKAQGFPLHGGVSCQGIVSLSLPKYNRDLPRIPFPVMPVPGKAYPLPVRL